MSGGLHINQARDHALKWFFFSTATQFFFPAEEIMHAENVPLSFCYFFKSSWHSILEFWISGVEVEINDSSTKADPLTVGLGFFLGVLIGAVIAVFCAKLCLKDIARSKVIEPRHAKHPTEDFYRYHTKPYHTAVLAGVYTSWPTTPAGDTNF